MSTSETFYSEFVHGTQNLSELAQQKGIKCSTAANYVCQHYNSRDAARIMEKLCLNKETVTKAYFTMVSTQVYRQENPSVKSSQLTPYIHQALGEDCTSHCLATSIIRRLYHDLCSS